MLVVLQDDLTTCLVHVCSRITQAVMNFWGMHTTQDGLITNVEG